MSTEQTGVALAFRGFFTKSKAGATGLTVTVDVYDYAGTKVVTDGAATEIGGGLYKYTLASGSNTSAGLYTAIFKTADSTVDQQQIPANWEIGSAWVQDLDAAISSRSTYAGADTAGTTTLLARLTATRAGYLDNLTNLDAAVSTVAAAVWNILTSGLTTAGSIGKLLVTNIDAALSAIKAKTDLIGSASATVLTPVATSGALVLFAGDDYKAADGRAVTFAIASGWPSLAGGTVALKIDAVSVTGTVGSTTLSFDLTKAQTATLTGVKRYTVVATLTDGSIATLATGSCTTT